MSSSIKLLAETVRSETAANIAVAAPNFVGIGTSFVNPARILLIQNLTDATLMLSIDGVNDNFPLIANGYLLLDVTTNKNQSQGLFFEEGTRVYVKELDSPTTGSVYVSVFYGYTS